jgi:hypothetical protein
MLEVIAITMVHFGGPTGRWNEEDALWFVELPGRLRQSARRVLAWLRRWRPESDLNSGWTPPEVWQSRPPSRA